MSEDHRFRVRWRLAIETDQARTLTEALAPETDAEHARLEPGEGELVLEGEGDAGSCLHVLDDVLACLTAATDALEADGSLK